MNLINEWSKKMAAKKKKIEKPIDSIDRRCGNCALGTFLSDDSNYDIEGMPICLECPHTRNRKRIRSEKGCDKWKAKK